MKTHTNKRIVAGAFILGSLLMGALAAAGAEPDQTFCEQDICAYFLWCDPTFFWTGCDRQPGGSCKTYNCEPE